MNYYLTSDLDQDGFLVVIAAKGFIPKNVIVKLDRLENSRDLDVIEAEGGEEQGIAPHKYAVVNEERKAMRLEAESANRAAKDLLLEEKKQADTTRNAAIETLITKLKAVRAEGPLKDLIDLILLERSQK